MASEDSVGYAILEGLSGGGREAPGRKWCSRSPEAKMSVKPSVITATSTVTRPSVEFPIFFRAVSYTEGCLLGPLASCASWASGSGWQLLRR